MYKVTAIISNYNRFNLLKQTIESLQKNTVSKLQIIVVDDASDDDRILSYLKSLKGIKYFHFKERVPIGGVKNKGISLLGKTDYIHFCDNDIYLEPDWDQKLIRVLRGFREIGVVGGKVHPQHIILERIPFEDGEILSMNNQPGYSFFIRAEDLPKFTPFASFPVGSAGGEDSLFCEKVFEHNLKVAAVNPPVLYHCGAVTFNNTNAADYGEIMKLKIMRPDILIE